MKAPNSYAQRILARLSKLAADAGGYVKLESAGYMPLHVEHIGTRQIAVSHTFEQNGDLMRDPEMTFWLGPDDRWYPASYRLDPLGVMRESIRFNGAGEPTSFYAREQADEATFAGTWMRNLVEQGFVERSA